MMDGQYITLKEAKAQCIIDEEWTGDDQLISDIIKDVEEIAESDLCVPLSDLTALNGALPRPLRRAMLLLIASYYKNREDEIAGNEAVNQQNGYRRLISNYRNYAG